MAMSLPFGTCAQDAMEQFRRAVLRAPPLHFTVESLVSAKANGTHNHGMRIHPVPTGHNPFSSQSTYDIWRRWEDCLRFQEMLEIEYGRAALEKKRRLLQGKGVKGFNGMYKQDLASSWDSLPAGPDPNSIAQDVHQYIPTLTKRGSIFRPSQATVERRQKEWNSFVEALFSDIMPALIQEIRATDLVTDFFGLWRRDHEKLHKSDLCHRSSDIFSCYFRSSNPSPLTLAPSPTISSAIDSSFSRHRTSSSTSVVSNGSAVHLSSRRSRVNSNSTKSIQQSRRRSSSTGSSDSSLSSSEEITDSHTGASPPTFVEDDFLAFGHNPQVASGCQGSMLDSLAEEPVIQMLSPGKLLSFIPRRFRASATESKGDRKSHAVPLAGQRTGPQAQTDGYLVRDWRGRSCVDTTNDLMERLSPISGRHEPPAFVASTSILISTDLGETHRDNLSILASKHLSPSHPLITIPSPPKSEVSIIPVDDSARGSDLYHAGYDDVPPSPTTSTVSSIFTASTACTSITSASECLIVKATHNDSIIMLRVSRDISLSDFREKVYNKFTGQEGIPLDETFIVAFIPPSSTTSGTPPTLAGHEEWELQSVNEDGEWEHLLSATNSTKLTLHILDLDFIP